MKVYTLKPEGFQRERRKAITRGIVWSVLLSAIAFIAGLFGLASENDQGASADGKVPVWPLLVFIAVCVPYGAFRGIRRSLRILREGWDSYELGLGDDFVLKKQANMPEIEIGRDEITRVQEASSKGIPNGLVIRTADRQCFISVPVALDGYDEVKYQLGHWHQLEALSTLKYLALQILVWLLIPAALLVIFVSRNEWLVLAVGIMLITFMGFAIVELRRSMNVDSRAKNLRFMILATIVLIVMVVLRVYALVAHLQRQ
jgi:hypothetical protein